MNKYLFSILVTATLLPCFAWAEEATTTPEEPVAEPIFNPVTINLRINALGTDLFRGDVTVEAPCVYEEGSSNVSFNAFCALQTAAASSGISYSAPWSDFGYFVNEISEFASDHGRYVYWSLFKAGTPAEQGIALTPIANGDEILLTYDTSIMRISAGSLTPEANATTTLTAEYFDLSGWPWEWKTATDSVFIVNGVEISSVSGIYEIWATTTENISASVKKAGLIESGSITIAPQAAATIEEPVTEPTESTDTGSGGGGGGSSNPPVDTYDISSAVSFLTSKQTPQGAIGLGFYSDWAAIGLSSVSGLGEVKERLTSYLLSSPLDRASLTDHERRAMALLSLGKNPYENGAHIQAILSKFDGRQFGDENLVNDDIFAIFPLISSGYGESDKEITTSISFILSKQNENGSWEGSIDLTSAGIQALTLTPSLSTNQSLSKARAFLAQSQGSDACFGNSSATAWALQAIAALSESPSSWAKNGKTPIDCLTSAQASDGGLDESLDENSRIWETAYSLPAYEGKTWNSLFTKFTKPASGGSSRSSSASAPENPTVTDTETVTAPIIPTLETELEMEKEAREATLAYIEDLTGLPGSTLIYLYDSIPIETPATAQIELSTEEQPTTNTTSAFNSAESIAESVEPVRETVSRGIRIITQKFLSIFR